VVEGALGVPGLFVTFEGGEGVGKTTQMGIASGWFESFGREVLVLREPGGTRVGEGVRTLLLEPGDGMEPVTELLLYEASRAELVRRVIAPALGRGAAVLCDRFTDSTLAYQAYGRGLDIAEVRALNAVATGGIVPDVTVVLVAGVEVGLARATALGADRIESESGAFHERVEAGFLAIAAQEPDRVLKVDGTGDVREVAARVRSALEAHPAVARWAGATSA
jgi:dTMP kinase